MTAPSPVCLKNWRGRGKSEHSSLPISLEKNGEGKRSSPDVTIGAPTFVRTSGVTPVVRQPLADRVANRDESCLWRE